MRVMDKSWHSCLILCTERESVISIWKSERHIKKAGTEERGINQTGWWPSPWDREFKTLLFSPSLLFFSTFLFFYPFLPLLSITLSVLSLTFFVLCKKPPCPEGIDLQHRFDPVVMILLFASATSFSPLQSFHKMLWIRVEDSLEGEERGGCGEGESDAHAQT